MNKTNFSKKNFAVYLFIIGLCFSFEFISPVKALALAEKITVDPDPCLAEKGSNNGSGDAVMTAALTKVAGPAIAASVPIFNATEAYQLGEIQSEMCAAKKSAEAVKNKTVGKTFFGIPVPFSSWDALAKIAMKAVIKQLTDSTVKWINTGFNGNPAFVQDPGKFFADTANGLADNFIGGPNSPLNFLCTPFADKIKLSLRNTYYQSVSYRPVCTFSGIAGNLDDFYNHFSSGGWQGWISMTQNESNNPYDSYLGAQVALDQQIESSLNIQQQQLQWGNGFLGWTDPAECQAKDSTGNCVKPGPTHTPGTVIEKQLQGVLGQGVTDLGLARSFDDVVSALVGALTNKVFASAKGLISGNGSGYSSSGEGTYSSAPINFGAGSNPAASATCSADKTFALINDPVTWTVSAPQVDGVTMSYLWSGDNIDTNNAPTDSSLVLQYPDAGKKSAIVTVTSDRAASGGTAESIQTANIICGDVTVSKYQPLSVSCSPAQATNFFNDSSTWNATITGGSGEFSRLLWAGGQDVIPGTNSDQTKIWPDGLGSDTNDKVVRVGNTTTITHYFGTNGISTEVITQSKDSTGAPITKVAVTRPYYHDKQAIQTMDANITVVDKDQTLPGIVAQQCSPSMTLMDK